MTVVAFGGSKGGVNKSTLARALAVEAARAGLSVHLAELDTQGTLIDWHRDRLKGGFQPTPPVQLHPSILDALTKADEVDLLVLDSPGRADSDTYHLARAADLIVLPTGASLDDLRPSVRVANSLTKAGILNERIIFALTRITSEASAAAARDFVERAGYRVAAGYLPERGAYAAAQGTGRTITEVQYPSLRSAAETLIQSLIDALPE